MEFPALMEIENDFSTDKLFRSSEELTLETLQILRDKVIGSNRKKTEICENLEILPKLLEILKNNNPLELQLSAAIIIGKRAKKFFFYVNFRNAIKMQNVCRKKNLPGHGLNFFLLIFRIFIQRNRGKLGIASKLWRTGMYGQFSAFAHFSRSKYTIDRNLLGCNQKFSVVSQSSVLLKH